MSETTTTTPARAASKPEWLALLRTANPNMHGYVISDIRDGYSETRIELTQSEFQALLGNLAQMRGLVNADKATAAPAPATKAKPLSEVNAMHREVLVDEVKEEMEDFLAPGGATPHELMLLWRILCRHHNNSVGNDDTVLLNCFEDELNRTPQYMLVPEEHLDQVRDYIKTLETKATAAAGGSK